MFLSPHNGSLIGIENNSNCQVSDFLPKIITNSTVFSIKNENCYKFNQLIILNMKLVKK